MAVCDQESLLERTGRDEETREVAGGLFIGKWAIGSLLIGESLYGQELLEANSSQHSLLSSKC